MAEFAHVETHDPQQSPRSKSRRDEKTGNDLMRLQRLAGNAAVSLLVQRQGDADAGTGGGGGGGQGGGGGMMQMLAMSKPGIINVTMQGGQVTDASAKVGTI